MGKETAVPQTDSKAKVKEEVAVDQPDTSIEARIGRAIEKWRSDHLRNTPFSQDTGAWNVLQNALPELTPILVEELK